MSLRLGDDLLSTGCYTYNGDGLRVSRTVGEGTADYVWDVGSSVPVVLQDSEDNTYVYGLDLISRTDDQGDQEYYLSDGLGSTTGLTDGTGSLMDEYQYDVFGAVRDHTGDSPNEFTFTGEQSDPTGLEFLRARYYDPATGRFLGRDPVPYLQRYAYAGSNPSNLTDPTGLTPSVPSAMAATAECLARNAGKMLDIRDGNPCAQELADLNAAVQAMLEATWEGLQEVPGWAWGEVMDPWNQANFVQGAGYGLLVVACTNPLLCAFGASLVVWSWYRKYDLSEDAIRRDDKTYEEASEDYLISLVPGPMGWDGFGPASIRSGWIVQKVLKALPGELRFTPLDPMR